MRGRFSGPVLRCWHSLASTPGLTFCSLLILALGIGGNSAVFSLLDNVLLAPLPMQGQQQLFLVTAQHPRLGEGLSLSLPEFEELSSLQGVDCALAFQSDSGLAELQGQQRFLPLLRLSRGSWECLSTSLLRGHFPGQGEGLVSEDFWRRHLEAGPGVVGQSIDITDPSRGTVLTVQVAGVLPRAFLLPGTASELFLPWRADPSKSSRQLRNLRVMVRLQAGLSEADLQRRLRAMAQRLQRRHPQSNESLTLRARSLQESLVGDVDGPLLALQAAVALVLLIACFNASALLFYRHFLRRREWATRQALGADSRLLMRNLLGEHLLLACLAAGLAVLPAWWLSGLLASSIPASLPLRKVPGLDSGQLIVLLAVAMASVLLSALPSVFFLWRGDLFQRLSGAPASAPASRRAARLFLTAQVALATLLLVGAALTFRSFQSLLSIDLGFEPSRCWALVLQPSPQDASPRQQADFLQALLERLKAYPDVQEAGLTLSPPLDRRGSMRWPVQVEGRQEPVRMAVQTADTGLFSTLGTTVSQGRHFSPDDREGAPLVAILNRSLAQRLWPDDPAGGQQLRLPTGLAKVVGVVEDTRPSGPENPPLDTLYIPYRQNPFGPGNTLLLRAASPPPVGEVRNIVAQLSPSAAVLDYFQLEEALDRRLSSRRFSAWMFASFAIIALLLSAAGLAGVVGCQSASRRGEIALKSALGAPQARLLLEETRITLLCVAAGIGAGLLTAGLISRRMGELLFRVSPLDPSSYLLAALALLAVSALAALAPAWRAVATDPASLLRADTRLGG